MSLVPDVLHPKLESQQSADSSSASANASSSAAWTPVAEPPVDSTLRNLTAVFLNATDALRVDLSAVAVNATAIVANASLRTLGIGDGSKIQDARDAAGNTREAIRDGFDIDNDNPNGAAGIIDTDMNRHWITFLVIMSVMVAGIMLACLTSFFLAPTGKPTAGPGGGGAKVEDTKK